MKTQLVIRIDNETKQKFSRLARTVGKTASTKIRELVSSYIMANDFSQVVGELWDRTSKELKERGYTEKNVRDAVKKVRTVK